jgi:hypothetical protein
VPTKTLLAWSSGNVEVGELVDKGRFVRADVLLR